MPRITRSTWRASTSSLPMPFCTVATQPSANACAVAAIAGSVCIAFVATMPKSHGGSSAASLVACRRPSTSPAPVSRRPSRLIASTCSLRQVVRPHLDVVERRQVRREQRPDGAATDDAHLHRPRVLLRLDQPFHRLVQRHRHTDAVRLAHERAGDHVDLGRAGAPRRPRASTGSARCRAASRARSSPTGPRRARRPPPRRPPCLRPSESRTRWPRSLGSSSAAKCGSCGRPVSAATVLTVALKISFDHCAGRRSSNASAFSPDATISVGDLAARRRASCRAPARSTSRCRARTGRACPRAACRS